MTDLATPTRAARVLVLSSYQYLDYSHVLAHLTSLAPATFSIASQMGVGHALLTYKGGHSLDVHALKWQPTRPHLNVAADAAVLFWDGHDRSLLPSVVILRKLSVPMTIVGPDGNSIDLAQFCATLTNGANGALKMAIAAPTATLTPPQVIVDAPVQPHAKESKVLVKLSIPEIVHAQYEDQARSVKQSVEKVLSDRLRACVTHTSGRGLYFTDDQRSHLERITGGHLITDADAALAKIRVTVELKVGSVTIELSERVLSRCVSRAKAERKSLDEYVTKEVIQGLERATGIRPW